VGGRRDPLEKAALAATGELIAIAYAETNRPALNLTPDRARLSGPAWARADRWGPADGPPRHWLVPLGLPLAELRSLTFAAQLLHPGSNEWRSRRQHGSAHVSSLPPG
jgi:hypothetical protein